MNDEDRCPATNRQGERCGHPAGWGVPDTSEGPCKFHGGLADGGAREGAGAPEGNTNSVSHGAYADQSSLYQEVFDDDQRELADWIFADYTDRYEARHGEPPIGFTLRLFKLSVNAVTEMRVERWVEDKPADLDSGTPHINRQTKVSPQGEEYYEYKKSPALAAMKHLSDENRKWLKDLDLLPESESDLEEAVGSLASILSG